MNTSGDRLVWWLEKVVIAMIVLVVGFALFHLNLYLFAVAYKAAFLFGYLP